MQAFDPSLAANIVVAVQTVHFRFTIPQINFIHLFHGHHGVVEIGIGIGIGSRDGTNGSIMRRKGRQRGVGVREAEGAGVGLDGGK